MLFIFAASPIEMIKAGRLEVNINDRIQLNCSGYSNYTIEFHEIGEILTIEEKMTYHSQRGNPRTGYEPPDCETNPDGVDCTKTLELDVDSLMNKTSYQCRATFNSINPHVFYSQGVLLIGMEITNYNTVLMIMTIVNLQ